MGSRRGRYAALAFALAALLGACTSGAPPGFSGGAGDRWSFPLVGSLEDGLLVTPVNVGQYGPYLFAIDPDASVSIVDGELVKEAGLRTFSGPHRLDETDTQQTRLYAEMVGVEIGSLIVERRDAMIVKSRSYDSAGRRIHGVLGRDVLADSLVFGFDREQGLAHLVEVKSWKPPAGAIEIPYEELRSQVKNAQVPPLPRRLAKATIGGETFTLHVDLGAVASQLREGLWSRAKLVPRDVAAGMIDEVGTARRVNAVSEPTAVALGAATHERVAFLPYDDRRWPAQDLDGALGLGFFAPYTVWTNWNTKKLYLVPRVEQAATTRVTRWETGPLGGRCKEIGCITFRLVDPLAGKPPDEGKPHPGVVLSITRDEIAGGMGLEIVLEAKDKPALPRLIVNLPPHVDRALDQLPPEFLGATLIVRDASPFPRECPGKGACVDRLAR